MSQAVNIISSNLSGQTDGRCIPCSRISRGVIICPRSSHGNYKTLAHVRVATKQRASKVFSFVCNASYNGYYRRNPDFNQHSKQGLHESNNWKNEETDSSENLGHHGLSSVTDGLMNSLGSTPRFKLTETPGQKEKEIVELFRKIQAQLRERATFKEQKKMESMQGKYQEKGTVDSLLELLRKHSSEQGTRKSSGNTNSELDTGHHSVRNGAPNGFKNTGFSNASNNTGYEPKEPVASNSNRPVTNFRRSLPVWQSKNQPPPPYRRRNATDFKPYIRNKSATNPPEPALEPETELATDPQSDHQHESNPSSTDMNVAFHELSDEVSSNFNELSDEVSSNFNELSDEVSSNFNEVSVEEISYLHEVSVEESHFNRDTEIKKVVGEGDIQISDFSTLKVADLRSIARSQGVKGFSKLKKSELVELLSKSSL